MSKRHFLRPIIKAIGLYTFLFIILVVTILPVLFFHVFYRIWAWVKEWKLWWYRPFVKGIPKEYYTADFSKVREQELEAVQARRAYYDLPDADKKDLWGLSISGGGIRSATLGLGMIQTFISENVMKDFDYMSTVSGGGYIGSCLTSLMSLEERVKGNFYKQKILKEEKKSLENLLVDENLPEEVQADIYVKIQKKEDKIARLEWDIMDKQSAPNLHELDLTPQNSPFTTESTCSYQSFDKAEFNTLHQMHHLRTHGQYLTPDQGIGNRDVKRAFGAIWTGIMHNLFAYFTVVAIIISLAFTLLFAISNGEFFEAVNYDTVEYLQDESNLSFVMREIDNWYNKGIRRQGKFISEAVRDHRYLCSIFSFIGFFFSMGFLFFAFWYQRPPATDDRANRVTSGSSFTNEQEQKWLNFFRITSYIILLVFPVVSVALMIQFSEEHTFRNFYWIVFALPFFFGVGMIIGTFMITPLMEYSKFVWIPLLKNFNDRFNRGGAGKRVIHQINRRRNSPTYRSLYSATQGQAMYILILGVLIPFVLLAVFSLRLEGNFLFSLFSLGVVYYFFTSKFGSGTDFFNRLLERIKLPMLNLSVFLMMFITMSVFAGWIINWHGAVSQNSEIIIINNAGEGLTYDTEPQISDLLFKRRFDTLEFKITHFDTTRYQLNFFGDTTNAFKIIQKTPIRQGEEYITQVYPRKKYSKQEGYVSFSKYYHTDSLLVRIAVSEAQNSLGYELGGIPFQGFHIGLFKISTRSLILFLLCCVFLFIMGHLTNVNRLSLHYFYRDRLSETYLMTEGRVKRSEALARQGMPLKLLRNHSDLYLNNINDADKGPYHLIMAGLNLQGSNDLVRKVMKSEPFLFSKAYIGSASTGYVQTKEYRGGTTTLSLAMTISGAAVSTGMGKLSFAAQAFFMALFNLRTGFWIENPWYYRNSVSIEEVENKAWKIWKRPWWMRYLFYEMFGLTNAQTPYVNVSDGGFTGDNLGLLPLLQRQCKKVVVCDFEEDKSFSFEAFTHACRIANIEYNTEIEINLTPLLPNEDAEPFHQSKTSVIKGIIRYPNNEQGEIIYIKSSIAAFRIDTEDLDDMPVNVFNYKKENPSFPHETTADQFFNDVQFEAYRALGNHLATQALPSILGWEKERKM
ncbi:MAG: phage-related protein [Paraglaciecola sp.]|jgi:phage-related protein